MVKPYSSELTTSHGHIVQIDNFEMYYEEYGVGEPLVLLHGFGGCTQNWLPFIADLSGHYRLIVVDLRGHGHSTNPENKFTHRQAADDVFRLFEKLGVDHFSAMGMSSGGMTLLHMATTQSWRIDAMILISTAHYFPDQARIIIRRASFDGMPYDVQDMYRNCAKRGDTQIRQLITQFNAFHNSYDDMNLTKQCISTISTRTLIIHGDRDRFFPIEIPINMHHDIPHSLLWVIPQGDHVTIFDSTLPFTLTAIRFLDALDNNAYSTL